MTPASSNRWILEVTAGWDRPTLLPISVLAMRALRCSRPRIFQLIASGPDFEFIGDKASRTAFSRKSTNKSNVCRLQFIAGTRKLTVFGPQRERWGENGQENTHDSGHRKFRAGPLADVVGGRRRFDGP